MNNAKKSDNNLIQPSSRSHKQKRIQHALAPFEDELIAQLPTPEQLIHEARLQQNKNRQRNRKLYSLAVLMLAVGIVWIDPAYDHHLLATEIGEQKDFILSDGSKLQLNTQTQLAISYHLRSRKIHLQQGEVTFHVKHNPWHAVLPWLERSFVVYSADVKIRDIGTVFNVNHTQPENIKVSVLKGQVRVSSSVQQPIDLNTGQSLHLQQGRMVDLVNIDVEQLLSWQKGYLYFNDKPLFEIIQDLQRYGELPIKIADQNIAQLRISGQVDLTQRQQFIYALPTFAPVRIVRHQNGDVLITAKDTLKN